ncbi:hypothetical protein ACHAWF_014692 [Thalassiosira exigua]
MATPARQRSRQIGRPSQSSRSGLAFVLEALLIGLFLVWLNACAYFLLQSPADDVVPGGHASPARLVSPGGGGAATDDAGGFPDHYTTFSTACSPSQNWQSFLFFYYAHKVKQPGKVVRIASGCKPEQRKELEDVHERVISKLSPDFSVHFTPDFARISGDNYKYYNKPFGLQHWLEHGLKYEENKEKLEDAIIMVLDPDMILLRPLTYDFTDSNIIIHRSKRGAPKIRKVMHGGAGEQLPGWAAALGDDEVCEYSMLKEKEDKLPYVIHYCQNYWLGKWFLGKYRLDSDFLSCKKPLLLEPPKDVGKQYDFYIKPGGNPYGTKEKLRPTSVKREQFMICQMIARLNDATTWYKGQTCEEGTANLEPSFIFHHSLDPDNNEGGEKKAKW